MAHPEEHVWLAITNMLMNEFSDLETAVAGARDSHAFTTIYNNVYNAKDQLEAARDACSDYERERTTRLEE